MINFHSERQSVSLAPWGVELQPMCKHVSSPQAKLINPVADFRDDMADSLHTETQWSGPNKNGTSSSVHRLTTGSLQTDIEGMRLYILPSTGKNTH